MAVKRNVTVQLDEEVIAKVKILAAQRGTSISGLVAAEINKLAAQNERYERARKDAVARLAAPAQYSSEEPDTAGGGRGWTREELYAERTDRWA